MSGEHSLEALDRHARNRFLVGMLGVPLVLIAVGGGVAFIALGGPAKLLASVSDTEKYRQAQGECRFNVNGLRTSQKAFHAEYDRFVPTDWAPFEPTGVGSIERVEFGMPEAFYEVGWVPDGPVRSTYRVQLTETGFAVECRMDLDADGEWAVFRGTEATRAERVTPDGVF